MARSFTDEMTIDPETGLPALPEDYAWNVSRIGEKLYVELKKGQTEVQSFWDRLLGKEPEVYWSEYIDGKRYFESVPQSFLNEHGVLMTAKSLYKEIHTQTITIYDLDKFVGLYPPKSVL